VLLIVLLSCAFDEVMFLLGIVSGGMTVPLDVGRPRRNKRHNVHSNKNITFWTLWGYTL